MAQTTYTNFGDFYNSCPDVIIRDKRGVIYNFPSSFYNGGNGGKPRSESDSYSFANSRTYDNFRNGVPWTLCWMVEPTTYANKGSTVSDQPDDNAWNEAGVNDLNNGSTANLLAGYSKISRGKYENKDTDTGTNTKGYISADRGTSRYDFIFSVYVKKSQLDFFNDFINLGGTTKTKFLNMAADNASYGNQRYDLVPNTACNNPDMPADGKNKCTGGAAQWCRDDVTRIWKGDTSKKITENNSLCAPVITSLDNELINNCSNSTAIQNVFCKDIRKTSGSSTVKNSLEASLANYCGNDTNINADWCSDVKTACSANKAGLDDTTVANYKCNSLIKNLNTSNKISMLSTTMNNFTTLTTDQKKILSEGFNTSTSTDVETALCAIASNNNDQICKDYLSSNYKASLAPVTDTKPVLIMYFNDTTPSDTTKLFAVPNGMKSHDSLNMTFTKTTSMTNVWYAKLYTYITPSTTNDYLFTLNADDDAKLYINNTLIVDAWGKGCCTDYTAAAYINLNPANGPYLLTVEFRDIGGGASMYVKYSVRSDTTNTKNDFIVLPQDKPLSGTSPIAGLIGSRLYMSKFNPYKIVEDARRKQSLDYCRTNNKFASDTNCLTNINTAYALSINSLDDPYRSMINDYCKTNNRFATDTTFCNKSDYSSYILNAKNADNSLNTAINDYCSLPSNNVYPTGSTTTFCKIKDNENTANQASTATPKPQTMNSTYANTIRRSRLNAAKTAMNNSLNATDNTRGTVTQDVIDYIKTDFPNIKTNFPEYNNSDLIPSILYPYCEGLPDYSTSNLCNAIYTTYTTDPNIISSKSRINEFKDGIQTNAFMGKSTNITNNVKYKTERDSPEKFARYLPYVVNYCGTGDNIVSPECQEYYNNIQGNINAGIANQYNNAARIASFANKEEFCNNKENIETEMNEYNNQCNNDIAFYMLLFFIFVFLIIIMLGGNKCDKKMSQYYKKNIDSCHR